MGTTLFIIDPQEDFIDEPGAALPVKGAANNMLNLIDLLTFAGDKINRIVVALDQHPVNHIAHADMWVDAQRQSPAPYTAISDVDVKAGLWRATNPDLEGIQMSYVEAVEAAGETLIGALKDWWNPSRELLLFPKSGVWCTEQYSSFRAAVVVPDESSTDFNYRMRDAIIDDQILVAGEALSHCVAASVMDAIRFTTDINLAERMLLLRDCTSSVTGFEERGDKFLAEFQGVGGRVILSTGFYQDKEGDPPA